MLTCIIDSIRRKRISFIQYVSKIRTEMNWNQIDIKWESNKSESNPKKYNLMFSTKSSNSQCYINRHRLNFVPLVFLCLVSCGAWVWEELSNHVLLVPRDPEHHQHNRRERGSELEDDSVAAGCLDNCLPGCNKGHSVFWEGEADLLLHEIMKWESA